MITGYYARTELNFGRSSLFSFEETHQNTMSDKLDTNVPGRKES